MGKVDQHSIFWTIVFSSWWWIFLLQFLEFEAVEGCWLLLLVGVVAYVGLGSGTEPTVIFGRGSIIIKLLKSFLDLSIPFWNGVRRYGGLRFGPREHIWFRFPGCVLTIVARLVLLHGFHVGHFAYHIGSFRRTLLLSLPTNHRWSPTFLCPGKLFRCFGILISSLERLHHFFHRGDWPLGNPVGTFIWHTHWRLFHVLPMLHLGFNIFHFLLELLHVQPEFIYDLFPDLDWFYANH